MMKKGFAIIPAVFIIYFATFFVYAEDKENPPVGMEYIMVGDARVLVPKGTHIQKQGDLNVVEDVSEYSSRKFVDIDERFGRIETGQAEFSSETRARLERIESYQKRFEEELTRLRVETEAIRKGHGD